MSQPVKLSEALVLDARLAGEVVERSIAGQVEFWARLGRAVDLLLEGQQAITLCRTAQAQPLSACLASVDSAAGRIRLSQYLEGRPYPHYEPHPSRPGLLIRIDENGRRTTGRFINRRFEPARSATKSKANAGRVKASPARARSTR